MEPFLSHKVPLISDIKALEKQDRTCNQALTRLRKHRDFIFDEVCLPTSQAKLMALVVDRLGDIKVASFEELNTFLYPWLKFKEVQSGMQKKNYPGKFYDPACS